MSKKQSGAAPGEELEPQAGEGRGWFGRLRAQPGFRTASIAFVLTVVLGIGSTAAYAYWSQKNTVTQTVTTVRQPLPAIAGKPKCSHPPFGAVSIHYTKPDPKMLPVDARILVTVSVKGRDAQKSFIVENTGSFELKDLPGLGDFIVPSWDDRTIYVAVTTAYIDPIPTRLPAAVTSSTKITDPMPSAGVEEARFRATYFC